MRLIYSNWFRREDESEEDFYFDENNKSEVVDAEADAELNSLFDSLMKLEDNDQMTTEDLQAFFDSDCTGDDIVRFARLILILYAYYFRTSTCVKKSPIFSLTVPIHARKRKKPQWRFWSKCQRPVGVLSPGRNHSSRPSLPGAARSETSWTWKLVLLLAECLTCASDLIPTQIN